MKEPNQSALAYQKAAEVDAALLPAWKGLAELHSSTGNDEQLASALQRLVS